jgi:hypothetical protein
MNLKQETTVGSNVTTELSVKEQQSRSQFLFNLMRDIGIMSMTTNELEEWTNLMAISLEGKGDKNR